YLFFIFYFFDMTSTFKCEISNQSTVSNIKILKVALVVKLSWILYMNSVVRSNLDEQDPPLND
ncbi:hypothetical protein BpHYR1_046118, partial [Brachionus plicatilis]